MQGKEDVESGGQFAGANEGPSSSNEKNEQLRKFILSSAEGSEEMWKDEGLLLVVNAYLESNRRAQEFYLHVDACFRRSHEIFLMMSFAVELYDREGEGKTESEEENKCSRMLEDLKLLNERNEGKALGEVFVSAIKLAYEQKEGKGYMRVLEGIQTVHATADGSARELSACLTIASHEQKVVFTKSNVHKMKLEKKLIWIKRLSKASKIMFGIGFFAVPILTALVMVVPVPSAVEVLVGAFSATVGSIGKWCIHMCNKREVAAEFQGNGVVLISVVHYMIVNDMENMKRLVDKMLEKTESLVAMAEFLMKVEEGPKYIRKDISVMLTKSWDVVKETGEYADRCNRAITKLSEHVSDRLSTLPVPPTPKEKSWMDIFM